MSTETLEALMAGERMGSIERDARGRLRFVYREDWRTASYAMPLSLSMPLAAAEHKHDVIEAFLWGLLPDNEQTLERWARTFQVSARNVFALLAQVGEDCAGAIQFARAERVRGLLGAGDAEVTWLDDAEVAQRLRALREDHSAWRQPQDTGQFSLAGAQPKTALIEQRGRFGVPSGRTPTTHILKPPMELDGHAENEHFCLDLARALGLPAASSQVRRFEGEVAIVVERFDRARIDSKTSASAVVRLHQEDCCQALGKPPTLKYQNEGGPSARDIAELLRVNSSRAMEDVARFVDALAFNWLIGGTDAHAKNYSLLHASGGRARLAPLYDLASGLPYERFDLRRSKLAMKIGGTYRLHDIGLRHWKKEIAGMGLDLDQTLTRITALAARLPQEAVRVRDQAQRDGLAHPVLDRLVTSLDTRAQHCAAQLA